MTEWVDAARQAAEILGPELVKTGARWTGRQVLGTPAERGMEGVYQRAIAGLLVEIGEADEDTGMAPDPEAMKVAETVLGGLCSDNEAAGLLLNVVLRPGPVPVAGLRDHAARLGYEPDTLPFVFDGAIRALTEKVWEEFLEEAAKENSSIQGLVNAQVLASIREHHQALRATSYSEPGSLLPQPPGLVLGRAEETRIAKQALGIGGRREAEADGEANAPARRTVAVHGWPGIGKSTFVAALCGDRELREHFSGGVLFVPVGRSPEGRRLAEDVCVALGTPAPPGTTLDAIRGRIAEALSRMSVLLVFDDVWEERHVSPLLLAGGGSAALVATRRLDVAARLSTGAEAPLKLGLLDEEDSLKLIASRAPGVVAENVEACRDLVRALDGLPLALRVAADLLRVESEAGFDVSDLLDELTQAARVLDEDAPHDTTDDSHDGAAGAATTVRTLLRKSIERLGEHSVRHFARLGVLPPRPLSFDPWAAQEVWRDTSEHPPARGCRPARRDRGGADPGTACFEGSGQTRPRRVHGRQRRPARGETRPTPRQVLDARARVRLRARNPRTHGGRERGARSPAAAFGALPQGRRGGQRSLETRRRHAIFRRSPYVPGPCEHSGRPRLGPRTLLARPSGA